MRWAGGKVVRWAGEQVVRHPPAEERLLELLLRLGDIDGGEL